MNQRNERVLEPAGIRAPKLAAVLATLMMLWITPPASSQSQELPQTPAEPQVPAEPVAQAEQSTPYQTLFESPFDVTSNADWIQVNTGEWLKGRVENLMSGTLEFYSQKLEQQTFDWDDVYRLRAVRGVCRFDDQRTIEGEIQIDRKTVLVQNPGMEPQTFPRSRLLGISPAGQREREHWSGEIDAGFTSRSGNTSQQEIKTHLFLRRRTPRADSRIDAMSNYGKLDGEINVANTRASYTFDLFLTRRFYVTPLSAEYYRDPFQNVAKRVTFGIGAGWYFYDRQNLEWLVTARPSYQRNEFDTVESGEDLTEAAPAVVFSSRLEADLTRKISAIVDYQLTAGKEDQGGTLQHAVTSLEFDLAKTLDVQFELDFSVTWDRTSHPQAGADGKVPARDDFYTSIALGLDF